jgi:Mn-dependent DtxR family transcriptional regulator
MAENVPVGKVIEKLLKDEKKPLSTYQIAKKIGVSWSTANTHCYKLKDEGKLHGEMKRAEVGAARKMLWWLD